MRASNPRIKSRGIRWNSKLKNSKTSRRLAIFLVIAVTLSLMGAIALAIATSGCAVTKSVPAPAMTREPSSGTTSTSPQSQTTSPSPSQTTTPRETSETTTSTLPSLDISKITPKTTTTTTIIKTKPKTTRTKATEPQTTDTKPQTTAQPVSLSAPGAVAITFDDGPGKYTGQLLDALQEYGVKVTFFVQGRFAESRPDLIQRMHAEGHQIGNHTYSHKYLSKVSSDVRRSQLMSTSDAIERITGSRPTIMRPPGGYRSEAVYVEAGKQGMATIFWDIDPADWKKSNKNVNYVYNYLLNHTKKGKIILLHDIHETTVKGFIRALPVLIEHGFTFVTIDELVQLEPGDVYPSYWRR